MSEIRRFFLWVMIAAVIVNARGGIPQKWLTPIGSKIKNVAISGFDPPKITPVLTDTFRLVISKSVNPVTLNAAQISEIELYPARETVKP